MAIVAELSLELANKAAWEVSIRNFPMLGPSLRRMPSVQNFGIRKESARCRERPAGESLEEQKASVILRELVDRREARAKMFAKEHAKRTTHRYIRPQISTEPLSPSTRQPAPKSANLTCSIRKSLSSCRLDEPRNSPNASYGRTAEVVPRLDDPQSFAFPSPTFSHFDYSESDDGSAFSASAVDFHPVAAIPPRGAFDQPALCYVNSHAGDNGGHSALNRGNIGHSGSPDTLRRSRPRSKTFCTLGGVSPGPSYELYMGSSDIVGNSSPVGHDSHSSLAGGCAVIDPSKSGKTGKCSSPRSVAESTLYPPSTPSSGCGSITHLDCKGIYGQVYAVVALASDVSLLAPSSLGLDYSPLSSGVSLPPSLEAVVVKAKPKTRVVRKNDITMSEETLANRLARTSAACCTSAAAPTAVFPPRSTQSRTGGLSPRSHMLAQNTFYLPPVHVKPVLRSTKSCGPGELRHKETTDQDGMKRASTQENAHRNNLNKRQRPSPFGLCIAPGGIEPLDGYDATPKAGRTLVREFSSLSGTFLAATGSLRSLLRCRHENDNGREGYTVGSAHNKSSLHLQRSTLPRRFKVKRAKPISISEPLPIQTFASASKVPKRLDEDKEWRESLLARAVGHSLQGQTSLRRISERASPTRQRPRIPSGLKVSALVTNSTASLQISPNLTPSVAELAARRRAELEDDGGDLLPVDHEEVVCFGRAPTPLAHSLPPPKRASSRRPRGSAASTIAWDRQGSGLSSVNSNSAKSSIAEEVSVVNKSFLLARRTAQWDVSERGIPPVPPLPSSTSSLLLGESNRHYTYQSHSPRRSKTSIPPPIIIPSGRGNLHVLMTSARSSSETLYSRHLPPSSASAKDQHRITKHGSFARSGEDVKGVTSSQSPQGLPVSGLLDATHPFYIPHSAPAEATTGTASRIRAWRHEVGSNEALVKLEDKISSHVENERDRMGSIARASKLS